jgi:uncharacterized protein (DUF433 family)
MASSAGRTAASIDLRDQPAYTLAEAARYLKVPGATLRSWTVGRAYPTARGERQSRPLIRPAHTPPAQLSFWNLIEAHVLRSFRSDHAVSLRALRQALDFAERELDIKRLLLRKELCAEAGELFLERYGELISLSASGQFAMRRLLQVHLGRVEWDEWKFPVRLYPFLLADVPSDERPIAIDPGISFGRPVVARLGISTAVLADRMDAGEAIQDLAADYGLSIPEIEEAVLYERTA